MTHWKHRVNIKHLITDDESDENAKKVGKQIAKALRASTWARADREYADEYGRDSEVDICAEEFSDVDGLDHLNGVLDVMYDLADADKVWIG